MSATKLQPSEADVQEPLQPVLGERFALNWKHALACACFALFFIYLNYIPLFHSDIWGHVLYGHWILEHGTLPQFDPFLPVAEGVRVVDNAWLSQWIFGWADRLGGPQYLSNVFALTVLGSYLLQARAFYLFSRSTILALCGAGISFFVGFSRHAIIRPEIFGFFCFSMLLWMVVRLEPWRSRAKAFDRQDRGSTGQFPLWIWLAVPILFAAWANLHGSFVVGLVLMGCHAVGRLIEVAWQKRSLPAVFSDRQARNWILLTELALLATLVNPYGLDLLIETVRFGRNPNLKDVLEWFPLRFIDLEGIQFGVALAGMIFLIRQSRQRMCVADGLLLLVFTAAMAPAIRMIAWFAPVLTFVMMPHLTEVAERLTGNLFEDRPAAPHVDSEGGSRRKPRFVATLFCLLMVWCAFALSPISQGVLGGKPRKEAALYSRHTPLALAKYLRENPPESLVFAPQWWGEWLLHAGPDNLQVFMTTNVHLVPSRVWRDYMLVARGESGWDTTLDRYRIQKIVVHKELQGALARSVRRSNEWQVIYEDPQGFVAQRRESF